MQRSELRLPGMYFSDTAAFRGLLLSSPCDDDVLYSKRKTARAISTKAVEIIVNGRALWNDPYINRSKDKNWF